MEKVDKFLLSIICNSNTSDNTIGITGLSGNSGNSVNGALVFLQKSEESIISFLSSIDRNELEFPPLNSYYRRIIHCLGRRYNLVHRVELTNHFNAHLTLRKIYLTKPVGVDLGAEAPILKCSDWKARKDEVCGLVEKNKKAKEVKEVKLLKEVKEANLVKEVKEAKEVKEVKLSSATSPTSETSPTVKTPKFKILKRTPTAPTDKDIITTSPTTTPTSPIILSLDGLTLEEREAKYQQVRDRIFEGFTEEIVEDDLNVNVNVNLNESHSNTISNEDDSNEEDDDNDNDDNNNNDNDTDISTNNNVSTSKDTSNTHNNIHTHTASSQLNPDACPFFSQEPTALINHIYIIKPADPANLLSRQDFKDILAHFAPVIIKTRNIPAEWAFLLFKEEATDVNVTGLDRWKLSKWEPEYID